MRLFFLLVVVALGWFGYQRYSKDAFILSDSQEENVTKVRALATKLSAGLPRDVDAETTLLAVEATSRGLTNRYRTTMSNAAAHFSGERDAPAREGLRRDACGDRRFRSAMEHGFSIGYSYVSVSSAPLGTFTFRIADCAGL